MTAWTTTPRTWTASETLSSANLNAQLRDFAASFGAWGSYTPTFSATGFSLGNGSVIGRYQQTQKTCTFYARLTVGSTTSLNISTHLTVSLPVTGRGNPTMNSWGFCIDTGVTYYPIKVMTGATGAYLTLNYGDQGATQLIGTTAPHAWVSGDQIEVPPTTYEVA